MADAINKFTLKLVKFLLDNDGKINSVSVSGFVAYLILFLVNSGLPHQQSLKLSRLLNCNVTYFEFSYLTSLLDYECTDNFQMDEFSKIGIAKSVIFTSKLLVETFRQTALEHYEIETQPIDSKNYYNQLTAVYEWSQILKDTPLKKNWMTPFNKDLILLFISEYFIRFQWRTPLNHRFTTRSEFIGINGDAFQIETMRVIDYMRYMDDPEEKARIVFVHLAQSDTFAVVVIPYENSDVLDVVKRMSVIINLNLDQKTV
ncbi:hypothetical protein RF11_03759 [Thelohanellus kitauei]|uniref:Serpin domain-containing protein n=1 Tax=Thelohanellus kitauei TaxID=669202 RepID=A0A0C2NIU2_THEKT|nr:hypothetical protein RF11_03759 [Thelohanellus kitauei]